MADGHIIWQKCPDCSGTGINLKFVGDQYGSGGISEEACPKCAGTKYIEWGWMSKDDQELPDFLPA